MSLLSSPRGLPSASLDKLASQKNGLDLRLAGYQSGNGGIEDMKKSFNNDGTIPLRTRGRSPPSSPSVKSSSGLRLRKRSTSPSPYDQRWKGYRNDDMYEGSRTPSDEPASDTDSILIGLNRRIEVIRGEKLGGSCSSLPQQIWDEPKDDARTTLQWLDSGRVLEIAQSRHSGLSESNVEASIPTHSYNTTPHESIPSERPSLMPLDDSKLKNTKEKTDDTVLMDMF